MEEIFQLGEEVGDLLVKHTPLSLALVERKIKKFVRKHGFIRHPVLLQIVALYAGYRGKRESAERLFEIASDVCDDEDMYIELLINRIIYYLEAGMRERGKELLAVAREEFPDCRKLELLEAEIAVAENDWKKITDFIGDSRGLDRIFREMSLAGLFYKKGDKRTSMIILQSVLSARILARRRMGNDNFRDNLATSLRFMEKVARLLSPYTLDAFIMFKNGFEKGNNILKIE